MQNLKTASLRKIVKIENDLKDAHHGIVRTLNAKSDKFEKRIENIEDKLAKIMQALKIDD